MAADARRHAEELRKVRKDGKRGSSSRSGQWLHGSQANADPIWVAKKIKIFVLSREKTAKFSSRGSAPHPARAPALDPLFTHQGVFGALFGSATERMSACLDTDKSGLDKCLLSGSKDGRMRGSVSVKD